VQVVQVEEMEWEEHQHAEHPVQHAPLQLRQGLVPLVLVDDLEQAVLGALLGDER
jgi:hypothetical protein